jgi:hypothetical protein
MDSFGSIIGQIKDSNSLEEAAMELRVHVPDAVIQTLRGLLGESIRATEIVKDALTLFNWAVHERAAGRYVLSADPDGNNVARLALASLDRVRERVPS